MKDRRASEKQAEQENYEWEVTTPQAWTSEKNTISPEPKLPLQMVPPVVATKKKPSQAAPYSS